jgi:hypothetical protein
LRIYQTRRLPTGRQEPWMHCTRFNVTDILYRHRWYGVAGIPHRNAFRDHIVAFLLVFGRGAQGRTCPTNLVGARCP